MENSMQTLQYLFCSYTISFGDIKLFTEDLTLIMTSANSVSPLKIATAIRLIHAIHKNCIVYLFL